MTKGTPSMGKRNRKTHIACRRCGRHSYHIRKSVCSACSFGKSSRLKAYAWQWKTVQRDQRRL